MTMSAEPPSHSSTKKQQSRPAPEPGPESAGRKKNSKISGRILSACDACRQSKVRCTGGNPCLTCQWYQRSCKYSPAGRLGRPKGSKNKRTLMQQILNLNQEQLSEKQRDTKRSREDAMQWIGSGQQPRQQRQEQIPQPEPDLIDFEFDMGHTFDSMIAFGEDEIPVGNGSRDLTLEMGQDLNAAADPGLSHQAYFAQLSAANPPDSQSSWATDPFAFLSPFLPQTSGTLASGQQLALNDSGSGQFGGFSLDGSANSSGTFSSSNPGTSADSQASPSTPGSPPSSPTNLHSNPHSGCSCLQRLIRLLYHLEELHFPRGHGDGSAKRAQHARGASADSVLRGVQAAKTSWQAFIHCSVHGDDENHKEGLLLFAMSIRILLLAVQTLNSTISRNQNGTSDIAVSVGDFELMGDVKAEIIGVVVRRALWAIVIALQYLWERTGQPRSQAGSESGNISPEKSSPINILSSSFSKERVQVGPGAFTAPISAVNFGAEDENVASLLATLQCTMKTLEQGTQGSTAVSE